MCGYCIEHAILLNASDLASGQPQRVISDFHRAIKLQESPDIHLALEVTTTDIARNKTIAQVICCRGLEVLLSKGFLSEEYQQLLGIPAFRVALEIFTNEWQRENLFSEYSWLEFSRLGWVWDKQTFTQADYLNDLVQQLDIDYATKQLELYVELFLESGDLRRNDSYENLVSFDESKVIHDLFPIFWCAIYWLQERNPFNSVLWELVRESPVICPDFDAFELWIQRRSALIIYDQQGLAPFQKNFASIRAELFQFISIMRHLSNEERAGLLAALKNTSGYCGDYFDILEWLEDG